MFKIIVFFSESVLFFAFRHKRNGRRVIVRISLQATGIK